MNEIRMGTPRRLERSLVLPVAAAVASVLLMTGCAALPSISPSSSERSSSGNKEALGHTEDSPCNLLDDEIVESLLGDAPAPFETPVPGSPIPACHYGDITEHGVQVIQIPAEDWAQALPGTVEALKANAAGVVKAEDLRKFEEAAARISSGDIVSPDEACGYFSALLEVQGMEAGSTVVVNFVPDQETAIAITAQQCANGTYTSLLVGGSELAQDPAAGPRLLEVLDQVAPRP